VIEAWRKARSSALRKIIKQIKKEHTIMSIENNLVVPLKSLVKALTGEFNYLLDAH